MGGIEADGGKVSERSDMAAVVSGADGIATILDQPEPIFPAKGGDAREIERIAKRVREDDTTSALGEGGGQLLRVNVIGSELHVDEDRNQLVLDDRIDGGGEPRRDGNDLVSGAQAPLLQLGRGQRGEGEEVGR